MKTPTQIFKEYLDTNSPKVADVKNSMIGIDDVWEVIGIIEKELSGEQDNSYMGVTDKKRLSDKENK